MQLPVLLFKRVQTILSRSKSPVVFAAGFPNLTQTLPIETNAIICRIDNILPLPYLEILAITLIPGNQLLTTIP
ncbi:hypothetical protein SAMN05444008_10551 [Cnuella takakiae]|uniref:Uncharacterized protein n=1 Tax=Cnuella takakiae TaxID=1302690 RepID=A0A1M4Z2B3_9BACT|nr:hypothetical protein BUE76_22605 [Cnuella takakiae]SHF11736.1 hypothetical protein SAMN05444008_10551 [Cnuella takakiae]